MKSETRLVDQLDDLGSDGHVWEDPPGGRAVVGGARGTGHVWYAVCLQHQLLQGPGHWGQRQPSSGMNLEIHTQHLEWMFYQTTFGIASKFEIKGF